MRVLSLCDRSHVALRPWQSAGYSCTAVDLAPADTPWDGIAHERVDVRDYQAPADTVFVLAWPPCTDLSKAGAWTWAAKGASALQSALDLVRACVDVAGQRPWILENPVGRLSTHWRKPDAKVHPWQFAALSGAQDAYSKLTCLWLGNGALAPVPVAWSGEVNKGRIVNASGNGPRRQARRSLTPAGLAQAIFLANRRM